ncbi:putative hydrolase of the HAD superfamily [Paraperlucidibaca baekdonensis]|uniref:Putative hydrolase of the HAD superfamily n=1 Tax=Paraperlucidibaca baekdonensis TaxID=748120 RepID=A0A3E0H8B2_9GAMM|nr:HAD-IA family hydrolase [Paraperlucidibaca baekdonensis]REH39961.1 putative hydrolase of the HAD superfamily [Paraperlucidibaca baekdonensis]
MTPIRLITFDLDNTLWDVEPVIVRADAAMNAWLINAHPAWQTLDHSDLSACQRAAREQLANEHHNLTALRIATLEIALTQCGLDAEQASTSARAAFAVFHAERNNVTLYDDAIDMLQTLANRYDIHAISNGNADITQMAIAPYFRAHFSAESVGVAKPDPAIFEAALTYAGISATGAVHVGDHPEQDIAAAQAVGMRAIWYNPSGAPWPLAGAPDAQVQSLAALPAAIIALG